MRKNFKLFLVGAATTLAVATSAVAFNNDLGIAAKADQEELSITWDSTLKKSAGAYTASTSNGTKFSIYASGTQSMPGVLYYIADNGGGVYMSSDNSFGFQAIKSITVNYKTGTSGVLDLRVNNNNSSSSFIETFNMKQGVSKSTDIQNNTYNIANPLTANYFYIFSSSSATINSITVNYLCE